MDDPAPLITIHDRDDRSIASSCDKKELDFSCRDTSSDLSRDSTSDHIEDGVDHTFIQMSGSESRHSDHIDGPRSRRLVGAIQRLLHLGDRSRESYQPVSISAQLPDHHSPSDLSPQPSSRLARTVRAIFNYPSPTVATLRSTAWLDGLRGIAALEVFIFHYNQGWIDEGLNWGTDEYSDPSWYHAPFLRTFYASGSTAVCVFFAISGYVLSHRVLMLYRQDRQPEAFKALSSAVFRRALRLFFPVMVLSFFLMLICHAFPSLPRPTTYDLQPTFLAELSHWGTTMVHMIPPLRYPDRGPDLFDPYAGAVSWTIPLEYYGSIVVFVALLFISQIQNLKLRVAVVMAMVLQSFVKDDWIAGQFLLGTAYADWHLGYSTTTTTPAASSRRSTFRLAAILSWLTFFFGFYLAGIPGFLPLPGADEELLAQQTGQPMGLHVLPRPGFDWIVAPIIELGWYHGNRAVDRYLECLSGICIVAGIGGGLGGRGGTALLRRALDSRPAQYLGKISFGLYLCHVPLRAWLNVLNPVWLGLVGLEADVDWQTREASGALFGAYMMRMVVAVLVNLVVAGLFERVVDRPSVALGRKLEGWFLSVKAEQKPAELPQHCGGMEEVNIGRAEMVQTNHDR